MLWWLKMSNISARNSNDTRSVTWKVLPSAKSAFHAPGPRNAFLAVMFAGKGPKVSMHPSHAALHVESAPGSVSKENSFGFPVGVEPLALMLVIVPFGVYRGIPEGTPLLPASVFVLSMMEKGTPVRPVNTGMRLQPPSTCRCQPRPLLKNGSCQMALNTRR